MKKQIVYLVILGSLSSLNAGDFYAGLDFEAGTGEHSISVDDVEVAESEDLSTSSYGLHVGYMLGELGNIELSYGGLKLEDDDVTRIGIDYIRTLKISSFEPYIGVGLSTNSMSDSDVETGIGGRLRVGTYFEVMPNLDMGAELNFNYIKWEDETDAYGRKWELSSIYYGLGLNMNYKF